MQVLAAPSHPDADFRVSVDQLERVLAILRPRFDTVIVDCGSRLDPRTLWMLEQASTHVFVIFPEIAALRATSLLLGFLAETATLRAKTHFVVNHIFPKELLKTRDIENLLRAKPAAEIPYTEVEMIRAVNEGVPVVTSRPGSPVAMAMHPDGAGDRGHPDRDARRCAWPAAPQEHLRPSLTSIAVEVGSARIRGAGGGIRTPTSLSGPPGLSRLRIPFRHSGADLIRGATRRPGPSAELYRSSQGGTSCLCHYAGGRSTVAGMARTDYRKLMANGNPKMLEDYFSRSSNLFAIVSDSGTFDQVNASWTKVMGYAPTELLGRPFLSLVHANDLMRTLALFNEANPTGARVTQFTNRYRHRDGSYRWLQWTGRRIPELGVHFSAARDITDLPEAQAAGA